MGGFFQGDILNAEEVSRSPSIETEMTFQRILRERSAISEAFVQFLWQAGCFEQEALRTLDGRPLRILRSGQLNRDAGPDFRDAEIILDGVLLQGSVELHVNVSDWRSHGHAEDPAYASVILHVALWDDGPHLQTPAGSHRIPTLALFPYLSAPLDEVIGWWHEERADACPLSPQPPPQAVVLDVLRQLGRERFLEKIEHFRFRVERASYDQVCYEGLLDALGYAANREPFQELARRLPWEQLAGKPRLVMEALLLGTAGLLPAQRGETPSEDGQRYAEVLAELWYGFQDAPTPLPSEMWKFARLRPSNYPTRRLAAMAGLLDECAEGALFAHFMPETAQLVGEAPRRVLRSLRKRLMPEAKGFWEGHSRFTGKPHRRTRYLIGEGRASDIVVNVILPLLACWAEDAEIAVVREAMERCYAVHPSLQENHITRQLTSWLGLSSAPRTAQIQQGMIYLHRLFCTSSLCGLCPLAQDSP